LDTVVANLHISYIPIGITPRYIFESIIITY